jgi:anaerobic magnesium-protoporphyrin IX monomethyl ester cyclase
MSIRLGFIFPSSEYLHDPFRGDPHTHFQILTVLEDYFGSDIEVLLIDLRGVKKSFAIYHIPECDVYLHSVYTLDYDEQTSIVQSLRNRYPKAKHIAGGPHVNTFQQKCLETFDSLVVGDGEKAIIQAIKDLKDLKLKEVYCAEEMEDINCYPYPLRKYLPEAAIARPGLMNLKHQKKLQKMLGSTVIFSRGCSYKCAFCAMPESRQFGPRIRYRDPLRIEEEINYLQREYKIEGISLLDEIAFPLTTKKAIPHIEAMGRTGIKWRAQCRVDGMNPELAQLIKDSGCITMCFGVESVSQTSLDIINKDISIERAKSSIKLLKKAGIEVRIYMIIGLPGEPKDIVDQTWSFIKETDPESVYLSLFTLRPGTDVYDNPKKFGIKNVNKDWGNTMHMYGRYDKEIPKPTFEYEKILPWGGEGHSPERIIDNYLELQNRVKENGFGPI